MANYTPILTRFEIKYGHVKHPLFNTTEYDVIRQYLNIPVDKEGFGTRYLAAGEVIEILPNPDGAEGRYRITEVRTFIYDEPEHGKENSGGVYKWGFHVIYFVEDVK